MTLYLFNFNNYYNRIVKKYDTLNEYGAPLAEFGGINFNPNDGVQTVQILNIYDMRPDYLICADETTGDIESRWYVIRMERVRGSQYRLFLYRDLVADWYDKIIDAPCFVEKAILPQADPRIFNNEDMTFNQIKTSETLLKDETNTPWLVGYCTRADVDDTDMSAVTSYVSPADEAIASISDYTLYRYSNLAASPATLNASPSNITYNVYNLVSSGGAYHLQKNSFNASGPQSVGQYLDYDKNPINATGYANAYIDQNFKDLNNPELQNGCTWLVSGLRTGYRGQKQFTDTNYFVTGFSSKFAQMNSVVGSYINISSENDMIAALNENGKVIYVTDEDAYYSVSVTRASAGENEIAVSAGNLYNLFVEGMSGTADAYNARYSSDIFRRDYFKENPNAYSFSVRYTSDTVKVLITKLPIQGLQYTATIPRDRYTVGDAPYDMFCMPFSDDINIYKNGTLQFKSSKTHAWNAFMGLATKFKEAGFIYDIQLLPYCPVRYMIVDDGIDIADHKVGTFTSKELGEIGDPKVVAYIMFAVKSSDSFVIPYSISISDKKVQGQTDMWRLCSPNYSGQFEFNAARNDGVDYIEVDYTYKPYTPYIHLAPNFKGLYGADFNDARGLVCGGDYSLPAISSAWDTYELQNKNYQLTFDRQIQNMEVNNSIQKKMDVVNAATGVLSGVASGAMAGSAGGGWGALAGGVVGGVASAVGGAADIMLNEKLRNETMDYTKDLFGYSLGNIQALPYTLNKVSAFNANNKIFPFVEYYTCTNIEKQALRNKIKYNGMTVMTIGTFREFIGNTYADNEYNYIKGKLIRLDTIDENSYIAETIASEINKGVFV